MEYVNCNLCGADNTELLFAANDATSGTPSPFSVVRCVDCGLVYTNPRPTKEELQQYYPSDYYADLIARRKSIIGVASGVLARLAGALQGMVGHKMNIPLKAGDKILDLGCSTGEYLDSRRKLGFDTYGVELNPEASEYAREKRGLKVFTGNLEEAHYPREYFDGVYVSHVLEHVPDPTGTLLEIHHILKQHGSLAISIPDSESLEARLLKRYWLSWDIPRHLYHFSPGSIRLLLDKTGFETTRVKHDPHPGRVLASFNSLLGTWKINAPTKVICYSLFYPFGYLSGIGLGWLGSSGSMAVYARKKQ